MSGTLPQYRPGSRPLFTTDVHGNTIPVYRFDKYGYLMFKWAVRPGGLHENGRCVEWHPYKVPMQFHVLDYTPEFHRPSKHARARIRPRTAAERTRVANIERRIMQRRKSATIDLQKMQFALGL